MALENIKERLSTGVQGISGVIGGKSIATLGVAIVVAVSAVGIYWSSEPDLFSVQANAEEVAKAAEAVANQGKA